MPADLSPTRLPALLLSALLLGACATDPLPPQPTAPVPAAFKEDGLWRRADADTLAEVPQAWWRVFGDPVLDGLQERLVIGNENLKAALAQVEGARALLGASRAAQRPALSGALSASRGDSGNAGGAQNALTLGASAAWELDLWGRLSQTTRASEARLQASVADLAAVRLSAQALLAQSYFALRAAEAQQAVIGRSIAAYQRSLELTQARLDAGVASPSDVLQARTQLKTAQVQQIEAGNQRAQAEHAIAVLLGEPPAALSLAPAAEAAALPEAPAVPPLLPAALLQRRPDVAAASHRVAAAFAQIGAADAAFFPSLTLSASAARRGTGLDELLSAPTLVWAVGPALAQRLLDGGALRAASAQARANAEQAGAVYRQTVLAAFQEVEDNLVLADRLRTEAELQREALRDAQRHLEIVQDQYRVGTVSYLNVVTAQTTALSVERGLLELRTRQLNATNQLLKNIAGRW